MVKGGGWRGSGVAAGAWQQQRQQRRQRATRRRCRRAGWRAAAAEGPRSPGAVYPRCFTPITGYGRRIAPLSGLPGRAACQRRPQRRLPAPALPPSPALTAQTSNEFLRCHSQSTRVSSGGRKVAKSTRYTGACAISRRGDETECIQSDRFKTASRRCLVRDAPGRRLLGRPRARAHEQRCGRVITISPMAPPLWLNQGPL